MTDQQLLKETLTNTGVTSSSDLIVALYQVYRHCDHEKCLLIDPIYRWEYMNYSDQWSLNIKFIGDKLIDLDLEDYDEIEKSYKTIIDCLFTVPILVKYYPLDEKDFIGWNIFRELEAKVEEVRKNRAIVQYYRSKENAETESTTNGE